MTTVACLKVKNASGFKTAGNILMQKKYTKINFVYTTFLSV